MVTSSYVNTPETPKLPVIVTPLAVASAFVLLLCFKVDASIPDKFVPSNVFGRFSEYQFTANDLEQFTGFTIKIVMISTNESFPVTLKDFRAIALA